MGAADVACFLLAISALAHPGDTIRRSKASENRLILDIRRALMQDNMDYDSSTVLASTASRSHRAKVRPALRTRAKTNNRNKSNNSHRSNNRFNIVMRSSGTSNASVPVKKELKINSGPVFRAISDEDGSKQTSDRVPTVKPTEPADTTTIKEDLTTTRVDVNSPNSEEMFIRSLLNYTLDNSIPDRYTTRDYFELIEKSGNIDSVFKMQMRSVTDQNIEEQVGLLDNIDKQFAFRYKPTTKMMTTTSVRTFHTNPLPSIGVFTESGFEKAHRVEPGAYFDWNFQVVQPTPIPRSKRKLRRTSARMISPTLTWPSGYWTDRIQDTENPF